MKQMLPGEETLRTTRQHWSVFVPAVAVVIVVLVVLGALLKVLPSDIGGRSLHNVKLALLLAAILVVTIAGSLRFMRWRYTTFTLTNKRVLVSRGVLSRYLESIALDRIQDVSVSQGLLERIFKAGNVEIESAGRDGAEILRLIADPLGFSNDLQQATEMHRMAGLGMAPTPGQVGGAAGGGGYPQAGYAPPGGTPPAYQPPAPGYTPPRSGGV